MDILKKEMSRNFRVGEFFRSAEEATYERITRLQTKLVLLILQPLRDELGLPIYINSGYRNEEHNAEVGGQPDSHHLMLEDKCAADITCDDMTRLWELLKVKCGLFCYAYWNEPRKFIHISGLTTFDPRVGKMWEVDP